MEDYKAKIKEIPEHIVYYKDYFAESLEAFLDLSADNNFLQELSDRVMAENPQINLTEPDYNVLVYMDGNFRNKDIHYRFCDAVTGFGTDCEDYKFTKIQAFTAVTVRHKGPYRQIEDAHAFARAWIADNGYEQAGLPRDSAIDGCWNRQSEDDYLTEIQIPIRKKGKE